MSAETLTSKYIASAEQVMSKMQKTRGSLTVDSEGIQTLIEYADAYLEDAKYYKDQKRFETSLASIAYCEGLLEALRLLGAVKFEWPKNQSEQE
jgi:FAD synthetase